jgi:hypothetical protein
MTPSQSRTGTVMTQRMKNRSSSRMQRSPETTARALRSATGSAKIRSGNA